MSESPFLERLIDQERLIYIHSNRFITSSLFHRKFFPDCTLRRAWKVLETYVNHGLLDRLKIHHRAESAYSLTQRAVRVLMEKGRILARRAQPVHLSTYPLWRQSELLALRMALEDRSDLKDVWWVSGYEIALGITPKVKADFQAGTLDLEAWRKTPLPEAYQCPDGYFEGTFDGKRTSMALIYRTERPRGRALDRIPRTLFNFYGFTTLRLVVCRSSLDLHGLARSIYRRVSYDDRRRWFLTDFETALAEPFPQGWKALDSPEFRARRL